MWSTQAINYLFFVLEAFTIVVAIIVVVAFIIAASAKGKISKKGRLEVNSLNQRYQQNQEIIAQKIMSKADFKKLHKAHQAEKKAEHKSKSSHHNVFVIDFSGDIKASETSSLTEEINAILAVANKEDEVVVRLESTGGVVNGYGLAAAQLARIKSAGIHLVVAVDRVAASGGYMMASIADKIIASPFAVLGSIGVVAQLPNIHRLLSNKGVDIELHTAGKYKRTLTMFGENTEAGREKFKSELEDVHVLFKAHINTYRPSVDIEKVATGEYWFGKMALELNLVDDLMTSDAYLLEKYHTEQAKLYQVSYKIKKSKLAQLYHTAMKQLNQTGL